MVGLPRGLARARNGGFGEAETSNDAVAAGGEDAVVEREDLGDAERGESAAAARREEFLRSVGGGDSGKTIAQAIFGYGPFSTYENGVILDPAQRGDVGRLVWFNGKAGPKTCDEFLAVNRGRYSSLQTPIKSGACKLFPGVVTKVQPIDEGGRERFLVTRDDAQSFGPAPEIDPKWAAAYEEARAAGVEIIAYDSRVNAGSIEMGVGLAIERPSES